jgi:peroxiredoxin
VLQSSLATELERAFEKARWLDAPLADRLELIADTVRGLSTDFADAVERFIGRLKDAGAGAGAPKPGDPMPDFLLSDETGQLVSLSESLAKAPQVIVFHRGHWCPYCRLSICGLAEIQDQLAPAGILAISAERSQFTKILKAESGGNFPLLSDAGAGYALSLGLGIIVDEAMSSMIAAAGWDVPRYQGTEGWILPIPAVFVVGRDGKVVASQFDADYRRRTELADIVAAAKKAV